MYQDPALLRSHVVKIRLNSEEQALVDAIVNYTGEQKATLLRDLILERASEILGPMVRPDEGEHLGLTGTR